MYYTQLSSYHIIDTTMNVLVTGAYGRVGTALLDHQGQKFEYTPFDLQGHPEMATIVGDVSEQGAIKRACEGMDGAVHLAGVPDVDARWNSVLKNNIIGTYNFLESCRKCRVETVVMASSNHVVGMYEEEHAPELYEKGYGLSLDHESPIRPDSYYGTSKAFLEVLGRYYVESYEYPKQVYALRIGSVRYPKYDHPYSDAETGVEDGRWERESDRYRREVQRMKATWQSRRDAASLIECCIADETATFEVFYGVSDNARRWFDINRPREVVGYRPKDSGEEWTEPPGAK